MLVSSSMELDTTKVMILAAWGRGHRGAIGRASGVIASFGGRDGMQGWSIFANAWGLTGLCWLDVDQNPDA